ncbi:MAG TPA: alpha/beta hydrolase [Kouleothrix sp.]|nr:alpha/beta hydrolase [Kouleothrix sp.]
MTTKSTLSLVHLSQRPRQRGNGPPPLLILLHGYGSNEADLFGLAPYLDPRFLVLSVRAPYTLMHGSYAWFELGWTASGISIDARQAEASRKLAGEFIHAATAAYEADPRRVYVCGFSQGAMLASSIALTQPELVAGAVLMSGRVPDELKPLIAPAARLAGKPFLVVHGIRDTVLPIQNGRASRAILEKLPVELTYHEYPMAHEVSTDSLADVTSWLSTRLNSPA